MATANPTSDLQQAPVPPVTRLFVATAGMPQDELDIVLANLTASFPVADLLIATPNESAATPYPALRMISSQASNAVLPLIAADFVNANRLAQENDAQAILMLGPGASSLSTEALRNLANAAMSSSTDLAVPCYDLPPHAGLVNSAILYPLTRALFASRTRFPLAIDLGLSRRMADRLAKAALRFDIVNQGEALLWPVNEATLGGFTVDEYQVGQRIIPQPADPNINAILTLVTGSLFADIEAKAAFWQRPRRMPPAHNPVVSTPSTDAAVDIGPMIEAFRLAYSNLQEIWSLVLPPNSLLGLKRLSVIDPGAFRMPESLWARIVYDFLIAYRLRTINRGHLLGALIPLYFAWVAGHINVTASGTGSELHIEEVAKAFEADKPYLVARWRWPDRFNS